MYIIHVIYAQEDQSAIRNVDSKDYAHKDSDGNEDSTGNWIYGHLCYIVTNNLPTFCPCPNTLWETGLKDDGPMNLAEEISMNPTLQVVTLVLLTAFSQIYSENQEQEREQKNLKSM
jgi:hypothetical protein